MPEVVVNEIFHSIQGESTRSGIPCVFVRLAFCNLRCSYCDTAYAFHEGTKMSVEEVLRRVRVYPSRLVLVTGGEPLLQEGVYPLLKLLCDEGYEALLETGGSLDIRPVDPRVRRNVDFKCPGSGMESKNLWSNVDDLRATDEVKFVVNDRHDFDWAVAKIREHGLENRCSVLLSPVFGELEPARLADWILQGGLSVRLQLQLHKLIWEPSARGV
ncbi:MAG: radical SAM protein [Bacteroidetes bacterium]|nr:radical SAM protein [Bacteroidota bacterium]